MTEYPEAEVRSAAERLIEHHSKASEVTDWTFFVDETYTEDAEYICEYAGVRPVTAIGRKQIKETHYGEDMGGFEDWTFPYDGYAVNGNLAEQVRPEPRQPAVLVLAVHHPTALDPDAFLSA